MIKIYHIKKKCIAEFLGKKISRYLEKKWGKKAVGGPDRRLSVLSFNPHAEQGTKAYAHVKFQAES